MRRLDVTGMDDQDHLAVIGALGKAISSKALANKLGLITPKPDWMGNATPQGVSQPDEELDYLPLDPVDKTNGGAVAIDIDDRLTAQPQRPFRGERIVLTAFKVGALGGVADVLFAVLIRPAVYVGAVQVGATQGSMPASAFSATAFGVRLSFPSAGQGTRLYIPVFYPGLGAGDRIIIAGGIFGRAVR
jgi:hypothetical protein